MDQSDDKLVVLISLIIFYLLIYPFYVIFVRYRRNRRIKNHLVTSPYKLPLSLSPAEVSYVFSSRISKRHLYATILDLANRSVLQIQKHGEKTKIDLGPKLIKDLKSFEKILVALVHVAGKPVAIDNVIQGTTNYKTKDGQKISGSKTYVYWWLMREHMRSQGIINKNMTKRYLWMLVKFGFGFSFIIAMVSVLIWRMTILLIGGEIDLDILTSSLTDALDMWLVIVVPTVFVSFFVLKYRGWMLGRKWLLTDKSEHFLGQMESFREYVRLTNKNKLRFESNELKKESSAEIKPHAIAFGYEKPEK